MTNADLAIRGLVFGLLPIFGLGYYVGKRGWQKRDWLLALSYLALNAAVGAYLND